MTRRWIPLSYKAAGHDDLQWTTLTGCLTGATTSCSSSMHGGLLQRLYSSSIGFECCVQRCRVITSS